MRAYRAQEPTGGDGTVSDCGAISVQLGEGNVNAVRSVEPAQKSVALYNAGQREDDNATQNQEGNGASRSRLPAAH